MSNTFIFMNAMATGLMFWSMYSDYEDNPLAANICFKLGIATFMASFYWGLLR